MIIDAILYEIICATETTHKLALGNNYSDYHFGPGLFIVEAKANYCHVQNSDERIQLLTYMMRNNCAYGFMSDGENWEFLAILNGHCYALPEMQLYDVLVVLTALIENSDLVSQALSNFHGWQHLDTLSAKD